jgi:hypothetical protein
MAKQTETHRIDRVVPDLDDNLIQPNMARSAKNLRFAASVNNTDRSGGTLVNGMSELSYALPSGDNKVIGRREDYENNSVLFALWNSGGNHAIYRISQDGTIVKVVNAEGFTEDMQVSIAVIDGKVYWTASGLNEPKMVNIAKGVDNQYPTPYEEWYYTQIKRPGGVPLEVLVATNPSFPDTYGNAQEWPRESVSLDYRTLISLAAYVNFNTETGYQFSYYYVYDNNEESVLAPFSFLCFYETNLRLRIPQNEFETYLQNANLVKKVVFVYRKGDDGEWLLAGERTNPGDGTDTSFFINIPDIRKVPTSVIASDITDRLYDEVPVESQCNEIAQNRLFHANYASSYDTITTLSMSTSVVAAGNPVANSTSGINQVHKPGGQYSVGIEALDEYGRRIGVVNSVGIQIPTYQNFNTAYTLPSPFKASPDNKDLEDNSYWIDFNITGSVPSWVKYLRIVETRAQSTVNFYRFSCVMMYWYVGDNNVNYYSRFYLGPTYAQGNRQDAQFKDAMTFYHRGYALFLPAGSPISISSTEKGFVTLIGNWTPNGDTLYDFLFDKFGGGKKYKVASQVDNALLFELPDQILNNPSPPASYEYGLVDFAWGPLVFNVEVEVEQNIVEPTFFQQGPQGNTYVVTDPDNVSFSGTLYGDCYLSQYRKNLQPLYVSFIYNYLVTPGPTLDIEYIDYQTTPDFPIPNDGEIWEGVNISMNPGDIYAQTWNVGEGQRSIVNTDQAQVRLLNGICFSEVLLQGTKINGLSKFTAANIRQAPLENGAITAIVRTNATQREPGVMLSIGTNAVSSFYYEGTQLTNLDGSTNVTTTDSVLASQRPLLGNYGTLKLNNVCVTPLGTVYYWSENIQDWIRYTQAGLEQLGETYLFMNYARGALQTSSTFPCVYDQVTDEAILIGNDAKALVFSERYKTLQPSRDYNQGEDSVCPELMASLATSTFFFLNGHVWRMTPSSPENSFFGEIKNPELTIVTNRAPTDVKQWSGYSVIGPKPTTTQLNSGEDESPVRQSYIEPGWWMDRKGNFSVAIRRDENSTGGVLGGKVMESRILISTFAWDAETFYKLNFIQVMFNSAVVQ